MRHCNRGHFQQQVRFLRHQFLQDGDLPFTTILSESTIASALESIDGLWKDRIYSPLVTLWVFLSQVLNADHSCRAAVARPWRIEAPATRGSLDRGTCPHPETRSYERYRRGRTDLTR